MDYFKKRIVIKGIEIKSKIKRKSKAALKIYKGSLRNQEERKEKRKRRNDKGCKTQHFLPHVLSSNEVDATRIKI
jgi:hypothetical protein